MVQEVMIIKVTLISVQLLLLLLLLLLLPSLFSQPDPTSDLCLLACLLVCLLDRGTLLFIQVTAAQTGPSETRIQPFRKPTLIFQTKIKSTLLATRQPNSQTTKISPLLLQLQDSKLHIWTILPKSLDLDLDL